MSTAKVCKKCPKFRKGNNFCIHLSKTVSPWDDWCEWRRDGWEKWDLVKESIDSLSRL